MRTILVYFSFVALIAFPGCLPAQPIQASADNTVKEELDIFLDKLRSLSGDLSVIDPLSRQFAFQVDSIYNYLKKDPPFARNEKDKSIRTLLYFMRELNRSLVSSRLDVYDIPDAMNDYKTVLSGLLYRKSVIPYLKTISAPRMRLVASTFSQYKESALFEDLATYKSVAASPQFIIQFLENKPGFRYGDSLLQLAASYSPVKMSYYINRSGWGIQERIRKSRDPYVTQLVAFAAEKNGSELIPFMAEIAERKITGEEVLAARRNPREYFQLLVNTLQDAVENRGPHFAYLQPLRNGIHDKAISFYVNEVNQLHDASDAVRFASVKDLRPQDLYYIITSAGDELYTSSYLGLYKRLMAFFQDGPADSLFEILHYDNYRTFLRLAANYNVIGDFLNRLSPEPRENVLRIFISGIEKDPASALDNAMDIADFFGPLASDPSISEKVQEELKNNLLRCTAIKNYRGYRLYGILSELLLMLREKNMGKLWSTLGDYEVLKKDALVDAKNNRVELVLFYGDEDGVASFNNFLRAYSDPKKWEITKNRNWVSLKSLKGEPLQIFANRPLDMEQELDLRAQDSLESYLSSNSLVPTILVHRGHSYHLDKTMQRITPQVRLAILGSCGAYNRTISIASINPDIQVIGSKKTGSKSINDPILATINEKLVAGEDLDWGKIWGQLEDRFRNDPGALQLFREYFPPADNLGLFVLKLYKYYIRPKSV